MKVGITFDLRSDYLKCGYSNEETAEFDDEQTIAAIEDHLLSMGFEVERIGNVNELTAALVAGKRWDMVFNICEGMYGEGREALVPALLDNYLIPYVFSGPSLMALSLNKQFCKQVVASAGVKVPAGVIVKSLADADEVVLDYPLFVKPLSEGTGKGISERSLVNNFLELRSVVRDLLKDYPDGVLVEEYLPGREFTIGVVGNGDDIEVVGVMEIVCNKSDYYSYETKENYKILASYQRVDNEILRRCTDIAVKIWKCLGVCDGGRIDVRMDAYGEINFIEINPLAGLNPINSDLPILAAMNGTDYSELMTKIVEAAIKRLGIREYVNAE